MEWTDIKRLDRLVLETQALGARVEVIGLSGEQRPLYGVTIGDRTATHTIAVVAGCHAGEIIGPLSALSLIQRLISQSDRDVQFKIVPVVDPDFLHRNAEALSTSPTLQNLLSNEAQQTRDLEGYFATNIYPECVAVRKWLQQNDRIDAYFSLHSSALIAPGLFFYVGSGSEPNCIDQVSHRLAEAVPDYIPLLPSDPTGVASAVLSPGLFEIPISNIEELNLVKPSNSLTFIKQHFQPQFVGVSEMPLAVCPSLKNASLSKIDRYNREFRQTGQHEHSIREIDLDTQLFIMRVFVDSATQFIRRT